MSNANKPAGNPSSATKLLKARQEYITLATRANAPRNREPTGREGEKQVLRMQAFSNLTAAYDEYVSRHGQPNEEEEDG